MWEVPLATTGRSACGNAADGVICGTRPRPAEGAREAVVQGALNGILCEIRDSCSFCLFQGHKPRMYSV